MFEALFMQPILLQGSNMPTEPAFQGEANNRTTTRCWFWVARGWDRTTAGLFVIWACVCTVASSAAWRAADHSALLEMSDA
jgi:hypothetical protein